MPKQTERRRLNQAESRQLLDDYSRYRFRKTLSAADLARESGVKPEIVDRLYGQQLVDEANLTRVAHALGVSAQLLREMCGLEEMSEDMLETLRRFMAETVGKKERERGA